MKDRIKRGIVVVMLLIPSMLFAQIKSFEQVKQKALDTLASPQLLNSATAQFLAVLQKKDTSAYNFMRDLNLKFKTFQANPLPPGLGFSYQYDNSWTKNSKNNQASQSFNLNFDGNVTFKKMDNPVNFLESKFIYNSTFFWGALPKRIPKRRQTRYGS